MKTLIIIASAFTAVMAITNPPITGKTIPPVACPGYLCSGKADGNYEYYYDGKYNANYFLQCSGGQAYCQGCFPTTLEFSQQCNQCLYNKHDRCVTTKPWTPATTFQCPDLCPSRGPGFTGNIVDPVESHHFIACWNGVTVGCIACPAGLEFNEYENACLYDGNYLKKPSR